MEGFLAEVRMFGGNFAPRNWAFCEGQLLPINSNQALFSLLGCTFGGDCRTSFALPDLRGRVPLGVGTGAGLSTRNQGAKTGETTVTLTVNQIPSHSHALNVKNENDGQNSPQNHFLAAGEAAGNPPNLTDVNPNYSATANTQMSSTAIAHTGGGQAHNNMQPTIAVHYIICLQGSFPSRN